MLTLELILSTLTVGKEPISTEHWFQMRLSLVGSFHRDRATLLVLTSTVILYITP